MKGAFTTKEKRSGSLTISDGEIRITEFYEEYLHYFVVKLFAEHCFSRDGNTQLICVELFKR